MRKIIMAKPPTRIERGRFFSMGSALLWQHAQAAGSPAALAASCPRPLDGSTLHRWLYGDTSPRAWVETLREWLGIDPSAWDAPPPEGFAFPAESLPAEVCPSPAEVA